MTVRDPVMLRALETEDTATLSQWYYDDRTGLEAVFGTVMPTEADFIRKCNELYQLIQQYTARILMVELRGDPIGFVLVTDIPVSLEMARAHIYLMPSKRRYALRVSEAGITEATKMGIKRLIQTIRSDNASGIKLGKRVGFVPSPVMTMVKELR